MIEIRTEESSRVRHRMVKHKESTMLEKIGFPKVGLRSRDRLQWSVYVDESSPAKLVWLLRNKGYVIDNHVCLALGLNFRGEHTEDSVVSNQLKLIPGCYSVVGFRGSSLGVTERTLGNVLRKGQQDLKYAMPPILLGLFLRAQFSWRDFGSRSVILCHQPITLSDSYRGIMTLLSFPGDKAECIQMDPGFTKLQVGTTSLFLFLEQDTPIQTL